MDDRCENCERVAAELRTEFDQLRKEFMRRVEVIFDKTQEEAKSSGLLADIETKKSRLAGRR